MPLYRVSRLSFLALAVACTGEDLPTAFAGDPAPAPSLIIWDGANGGNDRFYFLPPLVAEPATTGVFDASQSPEVKICAWSGSACGAEVAAFSMTGGSGGEVIRLSAADEQYVVNWHTDLSGLTIGDTYRINVLVGSQVLGYADVVPMGTGKAKNAITDEEIALKDGSTLPIKFRIEEGAVLTEIPEPIPTLGTGDSEAIAAGTGFSCALTPAGAAYCWGSNSFGVLGLGYASSEKFYTPQAVVGGHTFVSLAAGGSHVCGVKSDGSAWCWGANGQGTLGRGTKTSYEVDPAPVAGGHLFASVSAGLNNTCGRTTAGEIYCWGYGANGIIGNGGFATATTPVKVLAAGNPQFTWLSVSNSHACALSSTGEAWCWGWNDQGQLGRGFTGSPSAVPAVAAGGTAFGAIAAGGRFSCALTPAGAAWCWGVNDAGQLGRGTISFNEVVPGPVAGGTTFARIYGSVLHACALAAGGEAYCWGSNDWAQDGIGVISPAVTSPTPVAGGKLFGALALGITHSCGINGGGIARCWGQNLMLQLGNPDPLTATAPVDVVTGLVFRTY